MIFQIWKMFKELQQNLSINTNSKCSNVIRMIQELGVKNLQDRRNDIRLTVFYKMANASQYDII